LNPVPDLLPSGAEAGQAQTHPIGLLISAGPRAASAQLI
jgi:hypothetical protein